MSFASLLDHRVFIERDEETGSDDYNQPIYGTEVGGLFDAAIQPKSAREVALISNAGASIGDFTIYCQPRLISSADRLVHDTGLCPKPAEQDFPTLRFELTGIRQQTGRGHHLAIDARIAGQAVAGVAGS